MINLPNVKKIGIKMSGGADSSLAAYLIAEYIIKNNLKIEIYPIVIIEKDAPFQDIFVSQVINFIEKSINFKFQDKIVKHHSSKNNKIKTIRSVEEELKNFLDLIVSGVTQLPKTDDFCEPGGPDDHRKGIFPTLWDDWIYAPFINLDKKELANLYEEHKLLDTLFPLTRSCVQETKEFSNHCGICWWCKERLWAFGKL